MVVARLDAPKTSENVLATDIFKVGNRLKLPRTGRQAKVVKVQKVENTWYMFNTPVKGILCWHKESDLLKINPPVTIKSEPARTILRVRKPDRQGCRVKLRQKRFIELARQAIPVKVEIQLPPSPAPKEVTQHSMLGVKPARTNVAPKKIKCFEKRILVAKVLLLGAGRQSSGITEMIVEGDLPRIDFAIFADTGDEPDWVYRQVLYLDGRLASVGIPLIIVKKEGGMVFAAKAPGSRFASMPIYTGVRGKKMGILRRQCTNEWKIIPSESYIRQWMLEHGHAFRRKDNARVVKRNVYIEQWYGIATDELYRMGERGPNWQKSVYPLIDKGWTTDNCLDYLKSKKLPIPKKSSCRVCPYHGDEHWLDVKTNYPSDFEHACAFDEWLRSPAAKLSKTMKGLRQECYLHVSCLPLSEVDFEERIAKKKRGGVSRFQVELFAEEMASGKCGTDGGFSCMS